MGSKRGPKMQEPKHDSVLQFVREHSDPFVTTGDVSEQFDTVESRTIRNRLNKLAEDGRLQCRQVGGSAKVWYTQD
jgi:DeoR/GlpR family transcriptional regulator of sugar metabolism